MDFAELLRQGGAAAWLFFPTAVLLGALHGLEPGHSKTMMAAFVIAVRGTIGQAILLALAATVSHTAAVWAVAILVLSFGDRWNAEATEPYFQLAAGLAILVVAAWIGARIRREARARARRAALLAEIAPRAAAGIEVGPATGAAAAGDAHARSHARELERRFGGRGATTGQVILFGLTGGLLPCPAAATVALLCLQVKQFWLGMAMVLGFSIGLALTLVGAGVLASLGASRATARWPGLEHFLRRLPYLSCGLIAVIGLYVAYAGLAKL